nr:sigma-70 family RNA polymerase sigma factor [Pedobacter sp. ASV19]
MATDLDIVERLQNNDAGAFDELYWKYHQAIFKNILKLTKDQDAAQDILQDVFSTLWNKRDTLKADQPVSGWLFVVSFNHAVNYTKKKLKEAVYIQSLASAELSEEQGEVDIANLQYELLERALQELSPQKRKVFELCKLEGKTYEQTALEMHISKHTVKEYLSSAMFSIKEFVKANPGYSETAIITLFVQYVSTHIV